MVPAGNLLFLFISLMSTFRQLLFLLIDKQFINKHEKTLIFGIEKAVRKTYSGLPCCLFIQYWKSGS